jgi:RHS repeat-associated protein
VAKKIENGNVQSFQTLYIINMIHTLSNSLNRVGIRTCSDYSPFGVELDGRTVSGYRYGFNGMHKDDEIKGEGNSYDFGARMLDPRIGRWFMIDPMSDKQPDQSTYKSFLNCPLVFIDPDGKDEFERIIIYNEKGQVILTAEKLIKKNRYMTGEKFHFHDTNIPELSNGFNYYSKTTKITINNSGYVTKSTTDNRNIIKYHDGIQDREYFLGSEKEGAIYETFEFDFNFNGNGNTQNGGWNLTSDNGGINQTKAKAKNPVGSVDIGMLLKTLGNIKDVKVGNKIPDIIISFVGISSNVLEVNKNKEKPYYFQEFNFVKTGENEYRGVPVYDDKTIPRYKSIDELMKAHPKAVKDTRYGNSNENKRYIQNNYPTKE